MVLACVAMLLFPSFWEGRRHDAPAEARPLDRASLPGRSTLTEEDLRPRWRGPARRGNGDG